MTYKLTITLLLCIIYNNLAFSQNGSVKGFIYFHESGQPAPFTNIAIKGTSIGATTNLDGYFAITNIHEGKYTLTATHIGYDTCTYEVDIKPNKVTSIKLYLKELSIQLESITVNGNLENFRRNTDISVAKVESKEIYEIPSITGEADIAQYLQVLPGVISTGDQGGQLFIRGGSPAENIILLDGMYIFNPFHSFGSSSVFDTDIIKNVEVRTGGFSSNYGGRLSSLLKVNTRVGNKSRIKSKLDVTTFGSKLLIDGPFKRKENKESNNSFILSYKKGYMDKSYNTLYQKLNLKHGLPFSYDDIYGKISFSGGTGNRSDFFGFYFTDNIDYTFSKYSWKSYGAGTNLVYIPFYHTTLVNFHFAFSNYELCNLTSLNQENNSKIGSFNAGANFLNYIGSQELNYGLEILGNKTDLLYYNNPTAFTDINNFSSEAAFFIDSKIIWGNLISNTGIRFHHYGSLPLNRLSLEPRFSLKYLTTENLAFKFAYGRYSQNLISTKHPKDITNHFFGFVAVNQELPNTFEGRKLKYYQQKATHYIAGIEYLAPNNLNASIEYYYKDYLQTAIYNRDQKFPNTAAYLDVPDQYKKTFLLEEGYAQGIDFSLKYPLKKIKFQLSYSYAITKRKGESTKEYFPNFDRRHNINTLAMYKFGKHKRWSINTRWSLASGFPFNKFEGTAPLMNLNNSLANDPNSTYINRDIPLMSKTETGRFPYYHRLDMSLRKELRLKSLNISAQLGAINIYNRKNLFYISPMTTEKTYQLPFVVNAGVTIEI